MKNKKYLRSLFIRVLISIILFMSFSIYTKYSNENLLLFKNKIYDKTLKFNKVSNLYNKFFGSSIPNNKDINAISTKNDYTNYNSYINGAVLHGIEICYPYKSGIVVFAGEKENYNNTIIIQGMDGIDYWYGNLTNITVKLYDYVESSDIIAGTNDNDLYVVFMKNGEYLPFEEYI